MHLSGRDRLRTFRNNTFRIEIIDSLRNLVKRFTRLYPCGQMLLQECQRGSIDLTHLLPRYLQQMHQHIGRMQVQMEVQELLFVRRIAKLQILQHTLPEVLSHILIYPDNQTFERALLLQYRESMSDVIWRTIRCSTRECRRNRLMLISEIVLEPALNHLFPFGTPTLYRLQVRSLFSLRLQIKHFELNHRWEQLLRRWSRVGIVLIIRIRHLSHRCIAWCRQ